MTDSMMLADDDVEVPINFFNRPVAELPTRLPGGVADLVYDALYVVRIEDCNPKRLQVSVKRPATVVMSQSDLDQAHLDAAASAPDWQNPTDWPWPGPTPPPAPPSLGKLHRRLRTRTGALVVFHLVDQAASFIVDDNGTPRLSIMTADALDPQILRRPTWVGNLTRGHSALSVVLSRGNHSAGHVEEHDYAIGVNVVDQDTGEITAIYIDPKIENDGGG